MRSSWPFIRYVWFVFFQALAGIILHSPELGMVMTLALASEIGREVTVHMSEHRHFRPRVHFASFPPSALKPPGMRATWRWNRAPSAWADAKSVGSQPSWSPTTKIWELFVTQHNLVDVEWYSKVNESEFQLFRISWFNEGDSLKSKLRSSISESSSKRWQRHRNTENETSTWVREGFRRSHKNLRLKKMVKGPQAEESWRSIAGWGAAWVMAESPDSETHVYTHNGHLDQL